MHQIALTLCLAVVLAGCAKPAPDAAQLRVGESALLQTTIADADRLETMRALIEKRDRLIDETTRMLLEFRRESGLLNADFTARREVVVEILDVFNRERAQKQLQFIELISAMKAASTAAEWEMLAEYQLRVFDPGRLVYGKADDYSDMPSTMMAVFLLGGGLMGGAMLRPAEVDSMIERINAAITEAEPAARATEVGDGLRTEVEEFDRRFIDAGEKLRAIYLDHDAGSRRLLTLLEALNLEWYASQSRNMLLRDKLKELLSADQWAVVVGSG